MENVTIPVSEQVVKALDGRPQRWLALRIMMPEDELSKRLNGKKDFSDEEISQINELLKADIKNNG